MSTAQEEPLVLQWREGELEADAGPIVLEYRSGKKKKKKAGVDGKGRRNYSRGLKDVQEVEGDMVKIARKATRSVAKAIETYEKERTRSADEKKDGAIEDFPQNAAKAMSEAMKEASDIPVDVVDALTTRNLRKQLRRNLKRTSRALKVFRF